MLEFEQDEVFIIPQSEFIKLLIDILHVPHVYKDKSSDDSILIYRIVYNILDRIILSGLNPDTDAYDEFKNLLDDIIKTIQDSRSDFVEILPYSYNKLLNAYMFDSVNLLQALDSAGILQRGLFDVNRLTYSNIIISMVNLKYRTTAGGVADGR